MNPNNIQTIIDKAKIESFYYYSNCQEDIEQFLKDSLTSILDGIENKAKELHRLSEVKASEHECQQEGYEYGLEDSINIINSHR